MQLILCIIFFLTIFKGLLLLKLEFDWYHIWNHEHLHTKDLQRGKSVFVILPGRIWRQWWSNYDWKVKYWQPTTAKIGATMTISKCLQNRSRELKSWWTKHRKSRTWLNEDHRHSGVGRLILTTLRAFKSKHLKLSPSKERENKPQPGRTLL